MKKEKILQNIDLTIGLSLTIYLLDSFGVFGVNILLWFVASFLLIISLILRSVILFQRGSKKDFAFSLSVCLLVLLLFLIQITGQRDLLGF